LTCSILKNKPVCVLAASTAWCGGFLLFRLALGPLNTLTGRVGGTFLASVLCMAAACLSLYILLKGDFRFVEAIAMLMVGAAANLLVYQVLDGWPLAARMVVGLTLVVVSFGAGTILAGMVESTRYVVPMCLVAALADIWSVLAGPTKKIVESKNEFVMSHAFVGQPFIGADEMNPVAGVADIIFIAMFLCIAARLGLSMRRALLGAFGGLAAGLVVAAAVGGVPGLPFIGAGFVLANWRAVRPGRAEMKKTAVFMAAMLVVFAVIAFV